MQTGNLTPRSSDTVEAYRFTGHFGQTDGFGSVLEVRVRRSGNVCLTLAWRDGGTENQWSVELENDQRMILGSLLCRYTPTRYERIEECKPATFANENAIT